MPDWKGALDERLAGLRCRPARRLGIIDELSQHLQDRYDDLCARGAGDEDACRATLDELDAAGFLRELAAIERSPGPGVELGQPARSTVSGLAGDLRYACTMLRQHPGFAAVVILTLALGIGASAAIFSVVNAVLLRPLPYAADDRLVVILHHGDGPVAPANFLDYRAEARSFARMGAVEYWTPNLTDVEGPEHLFALQITQDVLPLLGVEPALGRVFAPGEDETGRDHVVVLSDRL
jgi:hypothetical protein